MQRDDDQRQIDNTTLTDKVQSPRVLITDTYSERRDLRLSELNDEYHQQLTSLKRITKDVQSNFTNFNQAGSSTDRRLTGDVAWEGNG